MIKNDIIISYLYSIARKKHHLIFKSEPHTLCAARISNTMLGYQCSAGSFVTPYKVDIQSAYPIPLPFPKTTIKAWALLAVQHIPAAELTLRFVSNDEIQTLNHQYRHKN